MAKIKSKKAYESELKEMIESRTGKAFDPFLLPQVKAAAGLMRMIEKIDQQLDDEDLTDMEVGSTGQAKKTVNPLLAVYDKNQRTLNQLLTSLGLTYGATPSKINESTKDTDVNKRDKIDEMYADFWFLEKLDAVNAVYADSNNIINNLILKHHGRKKRREVADARRH